MKNEVFTFAAHSENHEELLEMVEANAVPPQNHGAVISNEELEAGIKAIAASNQGSMLQAIAILKRRRGKAGESL